MDVAQMAPPTQRPAFFVWILPILLLCCAYGLLG